MKICYLAFHTQTKVMVGAPLQISSPVGGEAALWLLLSPDFCLNWTCYVFLCFKGSLFLCHGSCWLFHSVLYWICKGPSLWSEYFRQLDSANWWCVRASVHNASFDSGTSSTRPVPSNKKRNRQHQRHCLLGTNDMGSGFVVLRCLILTWAWLVFPFTVMHIGHLAEFVKVVAADWLHSSTETG